MKITNTQTILNTMKIPAEAFALMGGQLEELDFASIQVHGVTTLDDMDIDAIMIFNLKEAKEDIADQSSADDAEGFHAVCKEVFDFIDQVDPQGVQVWEIIAE